MKNKTKKENRKMDKRKTISIILFVVGIVMALTSATLLFFGVISSSVSAIIGIIGIGLIASSNFRLLK
ncbi:MAG: hypothetical protein KKB21_02695 [Nanoarchaeota archaeon]|nr:hypothetical protein [Nanoarchaeota archaeon]